MEILRSTLHQLDEAIVAACGGDDQAKARLRELVIDTVTKCMKLLPPAAGETIQWFFSPHVAPRDLPEIPDGFGYVLPMPGIVYDQNLVKGSVWISTSSRIVAEMKAPIFFSVGKENSIAIGDDHPLDGKWIAETVRDHLRHGKRLNLYLTCERPSVERVILPLLSSLSSKAGGGTGSAPYVTWEPGPL